MASQAGPAIQTPVSATAPRSAAMSRAARSIAPRRILAPLVAGALFIALWYAIRGLVLPPEMQYMLPTPDQIVTQGFGDPRLLAEIWSALTVTLVLTVVGALIAMAIGTAWGAIMAQARWLEDALYPYAVILQSVPIVSVVPLIGFWFDAEFRAKLIVVVLCSAFPMITYAFFGFRDVDPGLKDLFRLAGASPTQTIWKLQVPSALPALTSGFQVTGSLAVVGAILADYFFARGQSGLGTLLQVYQRSYEAIQLFTVIIVACAFGVGVFLALGAVGRLLVGRWHKSSRV